MKINKTRKEKKIPIAITTAKLGKRSSIKQINIRKQHQQQL